MGCLVLHRRHGDDPEELRRTLEYLAPIHDRFIAGAQLTEGETILDVGCGDGLIAFRAAEVVGTSGTVIFRDISAELLDRCRMLADEVELADPCQIRARCCPRPGANRERQLAAKVRAVYWLRPQIEAGTARDSLAVAYLSASRCTEQP